MAAAAAASPVPALLPIKAITPNSTVAEAFRLMPGCGALPVVDEGGRLVDVYARSDVILLAANNTYRRVSLSEFTVGQALQAAAAQSPEAAAAQAAAAQAAAAGMPVPPVVPAAPGPRAHTCTRADTLRAVVEALSLPGVRRLVIVDAQTRAVEGVVSLSDVVSFLLPS
jgi:CBS domain-containing protein|tara:strand:- start:43 stop:549 length:507 start_codon:yes stop_codon:yes gene_type:complete